MENQIQTQTKKDYWNLAYKNYLHLAYFGYFILALVLLFWITKFDPRINALFGIKELLGLIIIPTLWFVLSQFFKKHDKNAIVIGYTVETVLILFSLIPNINIILLLVNVYFFYLVYKASKTQ